MSAALLHLIREDDPPPYDGAAPPRHRTMLDDDLVEEIGATLGATALGVYTYLARRVDRHGACRLSYARIGDDLCMSRRHAMRIIKALVDKGYVVSTVHPDARTSHKANTFTLPRHVRTPSDRPSDKAGDRPSDEPSAPVSPQVDTSSYQVENKSGGENGARVPQPFPADFTLTDGRLAYAVAQGMDEDRARMQFERLRNWSREKGERKHDWDAAWRNWVLGDIARKGKSQPKVRRYVT